MLNEVIEILNNPDSRLWQKLEVIMSLQPSELVELLNEYPDVPLIHRGIQMEIVTQLPKEHLPMLLTTFAKYCPAAIIELASRIEPEYLKEFDKILYNWSKEHNKSVSMADYSGLLISVLSNRILPEDKDRLFFVLRKSSEQNECPQCKNRVAENNKDEHYA